MAEVYYTSIMGERTAKYNYLEQSTFAFTTFVKVELAAPLYFFIPQNAEGKKEYDKGFSIDEVLCNNSVGVVTANDKMLVSTDKINLLKNAAEINNGFSNPNLVKPYYYRIFDCQYIYYDTKIVERAREKTMYHLGKGNNLSIICKKGFPNDTPLVFVSDSLSDFRYWSCSGMQGSGYVFPLYLYPEEGSMDTERRANLDETIWSEISRRAGRGTTPEEVFDYIYGVLHSPRYREQYKEFLKVDFPRIPYPESADRFGHFVSFGHRLRELHLMHYLPNMPDVATFTVSGDCVVGKPYFENDRVYINATQYFDHVPETAWQFYIGGYQPAQKWLKDRKSRSLSFDDLAHYRKIVAVLLETDRLMKELDKR